MPLGRGIDAEDGNKLGTIASEPPESRPRRKLRRFVGFGSIYVIAVLPLVNERHRR